MALPDWVRRFFPTHAAAGEESLDDDRLGADLQLLEVAQVPDLSGGLWLILDRTGSVQGPETGGPR